MLTLPLTDNTVCAVEKAVRDRLDDRVINEVYWAEHLGKPNPSQNDRLELLDALMVYEPEKW